MRRKDREITKKEAECLLENGTWGVLSTSANNKPYGVPVNYYYSSEENAVFFHCAKEGRKLENINANNQVSFAVVPSEKIVPDKFTSLFESVTISGRASIISDETEKIQRLKELCRVLSPGYSEAAESAILKYISSTEIVRIDIEEISGKRNAAKE